MVENLTKYFKSNKENIRLTFLKSSINKNVSSEKLKPQILTAELTVQLRNDDDLIWDRQNIAIQYII